VSEAGPIVRLERPREGVALLTVANPAIRNHASWALVEQLAARLVEARAGGARVSVLASAVPGHWIEHAWLPDLMHMLRGEATTGNGAAWFAALDELARSPMVSIAAISGDCSGGGAELGWACDLRIAEEQVRFGQPEVQIGVATGVGGTCRVLRLLGRTATAELVLDGAPFTAQRVHELGGLNRLVPTGQATRVALEWAGRLADRPPHALAAQKQMLVDADEKAALSEALAHEQHLFRRCATRPEAMAGMERTQARFDAGESLRQVYGEPRA
jgi:enoyl-CoA hydratase/carnithine racemase